MTTKDIARHARALLTAHGDAAEVEAARKATTAGPHEAEDWRRIRAAIRQLRGALAS